MSLKTVRGAAWPLVLLVALSGPGWAGDEGADGSGLSFEPRLVNDAALENDATGAQFTWTGRVPGYPDGTALHVTLLVEGRSKAPIRAAFVKCLLEGGTFAGQFSWPNQRLSPMVYKAQLALYIDEQRPDVRRNLIQEFGWPAGHVEVLSTQDVPTGTPEDRASFPRKSVTELRDLVGGFEALRAELLTMAQATPPPAEEALGEYQERLATHEKKFVAYANTYVVRVEGELVQRMQSVIATLSRCLRQQRKGQDPAARLIQCEQELKIVMAEIESRLPLDLGGEDEQTPEQNPQKPN